MSNQLVTTNRNELFTRAEVQQILERAVGAAAGCVKLIEYNVVPECGPTGFLGEYYHLHLKYSKEVEQEREYENAPIATTRLFVKTIPYQNPEMCAFIGACGMFVKEATLYEQLLNELRKLTPAIFCAESYYKRKDLFVMQNICDLGYEPFPDSSEFFNATQLGVLLKTLAIMHACSIAYEVKQQINIGEKLKDYLREMTVAPHVVFYTAGIRAVLAVARVHPAYQSATQQRFIVEQLPACLDTVYDMVNPSTKYRNVFCHRDVWSGNMLFHKTHADELPVMLVDYQLARYCPQAIDVLMAIYLNTTPEQRMTLKECSYRDYYEHFASALRELGIAPETQVTWEDFEKSFVELELFGALYNCMSATVLRVPGDYLKNMKLHQPNEFFRYTNVERTQDVLDLVRTNKEFSEYMLACVAEMLQLLLPS